MQGPRAPPGGRADRPAAAAQSMSASALDRGHRRAQLVRDGGDELVLELVERLQLLDVLALEGEQPRGFGLGAAAIAGLLDLRDEVERSLLVVAAERDREHDPDE